MKTGTCQLCGKDNKLSKKSHIIPKFMYKGMENEKNKIGLSIFKNNIRTESEIDYRYFDKDILCIDCETVKLSQLDKYGNSVLFGSKKISYSFKINITEFREGKICKIENLDYNKFKLFLLSILWRSHISKNIFFENIDLNDREIIIREAIQRENSSLCNDINVSIIGVLLDRNNLYRVVAKPRRIVNDYLDIYTFMIHGIVYTFIYKDDKNVFTTGQNILNQGENLEIPFYHGASASDFLKSFVMPSKQNI